jgi:gamma-carbonic anhydrase
LIQDFDGETPRIHDKAWVHPAGVVIGEVILAEGVSIWPGAVLRGDMGPIVIGANTNIQDGSVCHNTGGLSDTRVGERVTVGHRVILHGCQVGDDCLIGMGSILLDNCVIGPGSIVGAGALVTARKVYPPGVLILGSPAKVVRDLSEREQSAVADAWRVYRKKCDLWRATDAS